MNTVLTHKKIMVVEDDINIANLLEKVLIKNSAIVKKCHDGKNALVILENYRPDLILLDIMLPYINGFDLCDIISKKYRIPIILITAKSQIDDKIKGLELGADDYITKPFHLREVVIRIEKLLSRLYPSKETDNIKYLTKNIAVHTNDYKVLIDNISIKLNPKEFELLCYFINNPNQILKRELILDSVWGLDFYGDIRTVDVNVQRLRKKLSLDKHIIETIFGVGYRANISWGETMKISIKTKLLLYYSLISVVVFLSFNLIVTSKLKTTNRKIITTNMIELKRRTLNAMDRDYLGQNNTDKTFSDNQYVRDLRFLLSNTLNEQLIIYINGEIVQEYAPDYLKYNFSNRSFNNDALSDSYDINIFRNKCMVDYPMKLDRNDNKIIIRYFIDYSDMLLTERSIESIVFILSILFCLIIIILSMINSNELVKKLFKIKSFTNNIINNDFNQTLSIKTNDEIGDLANDLNKMNVIIDKQIKTIKSDRDKIQKISNCNKEFFDNVTHELKTPLTTIMGYSELLLDEFDDTANTCTDKESITIINQESNRLYNLVTSLLQMSFDNNLNIYRKNTSFKLSALIIDISNKMELKAQKYGVTITCELNDSIQLYNNMDALKTVLINLIDNSIKYNKPDGNILISTCHNDKYDTIIIEDTGIGIDKNNITNVFKPFFTENNNHASDSTGLGLSIVSNTLKIINGDINIDSEKDKGTKVTILLYRFSDLQ